MTTTIDVLGNAMLLSLFIKAYEEGRLQLPRVSQNTLCALSKETHE